MLSSKPSPKDLLIFDYSNSNMDSSASSCSDSSFTCAHLLSSVGKLSKTI